MTYPVSDACCTRMGWIEALIDDGRQELHISHAPEADLEGRFPAFCHDEQEMIRVSGWLIASYERITDMPKPFMEMVLDETGEVLATISNHGDGRLAVTHGGETVLTSNMTMACEWLAATGDTRPITIRHT